MKIPGLYFACVLLISSMFPVSWSNAQDEYVLKDGTRAVIIERQLVLFDLNSKRTFAPAGTYVTRDGRYVITVKKTNQTVVTERTRESR